MDNATDTNPFAQVPLEVTISVGKARPLVKDLLRLSRDAVLPLGLLVALLLILPSVRTRRTTFADVLFSDSRLHFLRPPLRGPPR